MRRSHDARWALLLALPIGAAGCGTKHSTTTSDDLAPGHGCVQGVVVNGLTADRVTVPAPGGQTNGIFALVLDQLLPAAPAGDPATDPQLAGEYHLCGLPLDETFPLLAWIDGYQAFEGEVVVHSTAASRSPAAKADLARPVPIELANLRLYPKSTQVQDLTVLVTHNGAPLADATVVLRSTGLNFLDPSGQSFLPPKNTRSPTQSVKTGADGKGTFKAADLVLGGHYTYTVLPPNGGQAQTAVASSAFVLGLRDGTDHTQPFEITVDLAKSQADLVVLSKSTDNGDPETTGKLVVYFNREIEIVPGTADQITGSLSGNVTAQLAADVAGNDASESVKVDISGNQLTLTPVFKTQPNSDPSKEIGLAVTYSGLQLRPKAAPGTLTTVTVNETVDFYR